MAGHGYNVVARWREVRQWWLNEPSIEFISAIDSDGKKVLRERALGEAGFGKHTGQRQLDEDYTEDWDVKKRKIRDEKAAAALGKLPEYYYQRVAAERRAAWQPPERDRQVKGRAYDPHKQGVKAEDLIKTAWAVAVRSDNEQPTISNSHSFENSYVPLHLWSGYHFGRSTMLAEELPVYAAKSGCPAAVIADPHSLVGCKEFDKGCRSNGIKPLIGTCIELPEGGQLVLIAKSKAGYRNLSQLITRCHLGQPRNFPLGTWELLRQFSANLICLTGGDLGPIDRALVKRDEAIAHRTLKKLLDIYGRSNLFVEVERSFLPWQMSVETRLLELAEKLNLKCVAGGVTTHARPEHFPAQDVLVCAETLCLIEEVVGRKQLRDLTQPQIPTAPSRALNKERYLRTSMEMQHLYRDKPELLSNTLLIADMCEDNVLPDRTQLPQLFENDAQALRQIIEANAFTVYGNVDAKQRKRLNYELNCITKLGYESHFLITWDMCRWAREQGIQMSGRGSVVDSALAYVLGFSRIDAIEHNLHFDRFLPSDGTKRPDIDVDFEAHRRDDIRGYLVKKYGVDKVATVAAIGAYCSRGIVREVGKVMGLPNETIGFLSKRIHGGVSADQLEAALEKRPELRDSNIPKEKFRIVFQLAQQLMDIPRNIRCHSSGVVISSEPIDLTVPTMWSATNNSDFSGAPHEALRIIQWDKRSAKYCFDKFDILCLRGQDVLSGVEQRLHKTQPDFSVERIPATTDPEVYRAMRSGELIGIPQSASPAMRQAHIRLRTDNLHDASLVQAGIRPGVGGAVKLNELIARRRGKDFTYEHPDIEAILGNTYGIIVFQEQVDQLLQKFCKFTSGQAEDIRDAIHKKRREQFGNSIREKIVEKVLTNGYTPVVAERVFECVAGFEGYGFAQGHALAFAEVSLRSVSLMQNYPSHYFASLLSAQPAGYYGSCTIANEARGRGVQIYGLDINRSQDKFEVEDAIDEFGMKVPQSAVRTGLMQLAGLSKPTKTKILSFNKTYLQPVEVRNKLQLPKSNAGGIAIALEEKDEPSYGNLVPFRSFFDFVAKIHPSRDELESLILSGAFDTLHANRRALLWAIPAAFQYADLRDTIEDGQHLDFGYREPEIDYTIEDFTDQEKAVYERAFLGMDCQRHLMTFERERIQKKGGLNSSEIKHLAPGLEAMTVGNPIRLRFPPTASGKRVVFFDLEDEFGLLNVTCFDDVYMKYGKAIVCSQYATIIGETQDRDGSPAFLAKRVYEYKPCLLSGDSTRLPHKTADFIVG